MAGIPQDKMVRLLTAEDLTDDEKALKEALLAYEPTAAGRKSEKKDDSNQGELISWEQAFAHPRFKELAERAKKAEEQVAAMRSTIDTAEKERLEKEKNFEALYKQAEAKAAELKARAEAADDYESTLKSVLETEIAALPKEYRGLIPQTLSASDQLKWLTANKAVLVKPLPGDIKAGKEGAGKSAVGGEGEELTPDELQTATDFGMKPDEYKKYKKEKQPTQK